MRDYLHEILNSHIKLLINIHNDKRMSCSSLLLKFDFKFGLAVLKIGDMQILVNLASLFLSKIRDWPVFRSPCSCE